ncbi:MAG: DEAD/DEAH box helicase [Gammaproteobacteria bacterium]|nr:DEAD/DEAH box helicase [Gammaproteobacteria bacterium]
MPLNLDLHQLFSQNALERGRHYFNSGHVQLVEINEDADEIYGKVKGSGRKSYEVDIQFVLPGEDDDSLEGYCSCPMEYNCKHVFAVLLEAERRYGTAKINDLTGLEGAESFLDLEEAFNTLNEAVPDSFQGFIQLMQQMGGSVENLGIAAAKTKSAASIFQTSAQQNKPSLREHTDWLNRLKKSAKKPTQQLTVVQQSNLSIVYLPTFRKNGEIIVSLHNCRHLKKGGLGKPSTKINLDLFSYNYFQNTPNWPKRFGEQDKKIVKLAYMESLIVEHNHSILLKGEVGTTLLEQMINTGRLLLDGDSKVTIQQGEPVQPEVRWLINKDGHQSPALFNNSQKDHRLNLVATAPPYYLRVSQKSAICGPLINAPDTEILSTLLQAPPLDNKSIAKTQQVLSSILPAAVAKTVRQPEAVTIQKVTPTPVLALSCIPWNHKQIFRKDSALFDTPDKIQTLAKANLLFDYKGQRVDHSDNANTLPTKPGEALIPRHNSIETQAIYTLFSHLQPAKNLPEATGIEGLNPFDLLISQPYADNYQSQWMSFINDELPELEEEGWIIEIADDFPFQFAAIQENDWYAELEESEDNSWLTMKLGITVDGESIDLLPVIARQLNRLPSIENLKKLKKGSLVPVALPGGKFINLPAERLTLIASTLLELFGDKPLNDYRIENHHAQLWDELQSQLGLPWAGGEKLKELANKLKRFKRLKSVKPAKALQAKLRPYQKQGLSWLQFLREYGLNGVLADDMGLGKTLQTLSHLQLEKQRLGDDLLPSLVVCPTSLLHNWRQEAKRFTPDLNVHIYHGAKRDLAVFPQTHLILTTYGIIQRDFDQLITQSFHLLVLDEAQAVKNPGAKAAKAIRHIPASHKLCLTGTPMENHLGELWSLYDFLMPGFLGASREFSRFYRTPIEKHGKKDPAKRLQKRIAPFMLRRTKDLVAKELPPKTEIVRTTELEGKQRDLYETIRASMEIKVKKEIEKKGLARSQIYILDALLKMRQACCDPSLVKVKQAKSVSESAKLDLLMSLVQPMVEEGRKILIFSQFTSMLMLIQGRLKQAKIDWVKLTGQTSNRTKPIDAFQQGNVPVFLISLKAGGTGLNLTAADTVIHYDPWWNPAVEDQASDRAHRIGQDKPVFVYKLVTERTVEEKIQELKKKKRAIADAIYGDNAAKKKLSITADDLDTLFEPLAANA